MINNIKKGLSIFGILVTLMTVSAVFRHSTYSGMYQREGNELGMQKSQGHLYANLAISFVVGGASLKVLLDKETWN